MNLADLSPRRWRERRRESDSPDFADMGTAFGLDASFALEAMQRPEAPAAVAAAPVAAAVLETPDVAPSSTAPRWWHRMSSR